MEKHSEYIKDVIRLFVRRNKQRRFTEFLESPKRYDDLIWELLNDPRNFKDECVIKLAPKELSVDLIVTRLRDLGAKKTAYIISIEWDKDGMVGPVELMIDRVFGRSAGNLVYCIGSQAGYYEGHESWRYLLHAPLGRRDFVSL